ncbi:MAG: hypothetical protein EHM21_00260, partial [Chloroflexi bacterium]
MFERLFGLVVKYVLRYWVIGVIFFTLVSIVIYSVEQANWVKDDSAIVNIFLLGLVFGWLLASSRFGWGFVLLYALFLAIVIPIQGVGRIVPALETVLTTPPGQVIDGMNLRAWELSLRVTGWVETLRGEGNIQDTGLFVLLMGAIFVLCAIWLMWSIIRQRRAFNGLLPIALLLAINVHLSRQPLS